MDPIVWMLNPPAVPPWNGPSRFHVTEEDGIAQAIANAQAQAMHPRKADETAREYSKRRLEEDAAARGEHFLPLEPGQQRRRRVKADGSRVKRQANRW